MMNLKKKNGKIIREKKRKELDSGMEREQVLRASLDQIRGMSGGGLVRRDGSALMGKTRGRIV